MLNRPSVEKLKEQSRGRATEREGADRRSVVWCLGSES